MSKRDPITRAVRLVSTEARQSLDRWGDFTSTHEAYGVLAEEVAELLDAIRANDMLEIELEAVQVAAVALRLAAQCAERKAEFLDRSGVLT